MKNSMKRHWILLGGVVLLFAAVGGCSDDAAPGVTDGGHADVLKADGAKADGSKADGSKADGAQADGLQADGSQADGVQADGTQGDSFLGDAVGFDININECVGKADGVACGPNSLSICVKEACVSSACGDAYVDTATGEECEDGNAVDGDGCTQCHWDCKVSTDCDDQETCNGVETCDTTKHVCLAGTPAANNTACTLTVGGAGVCSGGICVKAGCGNGTKESGEDCDDGNQVAGDGCESNCTWTCQANADCDDADKCTGTETCDKTDPQKPVCKAGTLVVCKPGVSCKGTCIAATGKCAYADLDKDGVTCLTDCNDGDADIFPGGYECKDGKDNDCDPKTPDATAPKCICYVDKDSDTYAPSTTGSITAATCPSKYTHRTPSSPTTKDCNDGRADANPGQTKYFTAAYCLQYIYNPITHTKICVAWNWDYNCSTVVEKQLNSLYKRCTALIGGTKVYCRGSGWKGTTIADCGKSASYVSCIRLGTMCMPRTSTRTQACH